MFKRMRKILLAVICTVITLSAFVPTRAEAASASTVSLSNAILPTGKLAKGRAFTVAGKLSSKYTITAVTFTVRNTSGVEKFKASAAPFSKSYSLYKLDSQLKFKALAAGSYSWTIAAATTHGTTYWHGSFTVKVSSVSVSGMTFPNGTLTKGKAFTCKGTVKANTKITNVTLSVCSTDGVKQFSASAAPNSKSYNVYKLDSKMTFSKLAAGSYVYRVAVTTADGITSYIVTNSFNVK